MEFSSVCGSIGELKQGGCFQESWGSVMCTHTHSCDTPSQLCCLLPEITKSPSSEPCVGMVKHWPEETGFS